MGHFLRVERSELAEVHPRPIGGNKIDKRPPPVPVTPGLWASPFDLRDSKGDTQVPDGRKVRRDPRGESYARSRDRVQWISSYRTEPASVRAVPPLSRVRADRPTSAIDRSTHETAGKSSSTCMASYESDRDSSQMASPTLDAPNGCLVGGRWRGNRSAR